MRRFSHRKSRDGGAAAWFEARGEFMLPHGGVERGERRLREVKKEMNSLAVTSVVYNGADPSLLRLAEDPAQPVLLTGSGKS